MTLKERQAFLNIFLDPIPFGLYLFSRELQSRSNPLCGQQRSGKYIYVLLQFLGHSDEIPEMAHLSYWHRHDLHTKPQEIHPPTILPDSTSHQSQLYLNMGRNCFVLLQNWSQTIIPFVTQRRVLGVLSISWQFYALLFLLNQSSLAPKHIVLPKNLKHLRKKPPCGELSKSQSTHLLKKHLANSNSARIKLGYIFKRRAALSIMF